MVSWLGNCHLKWWEHSKVETRNKKHPITWVESRVLQYIDHFTTANTIFWEQIHKKSHEIHVHPWNPMVDMLEDVIVLFIQLPIRKQVNKRSAGKRFYTTSLPIHVFTVFVLKCLSYCNVRFYFPLIKMEISCLPFFPFPPSDSI